MLYVLKRHNELIDHVVDTMVIFAKEKMVYIFRDLIKSLYPSPLEYATIVNDFIHILYKNWEANKELLEYGLLDQWIELAIWQSDNDGKHSPEERTAAIALMCDFWILFPNKLEVWEDLANQIVTMLKWGSKDRYRPLRIATICQTFWLMSHFA